MPQTPVTLKSHSEHHLRERQTNTESPIPFMYYSKRPNFPSPTGTPHAKAATNPSITRAPRAIFSSSEGKARLPRRLARLCE